MREFERLAVPTVLLAPGAEEPPPVERQEPVLLARAQPLWQEPKPRQAPEEPLVERRASPSLRPARLAVQTLSPTPRGASPC